MDGYALPSRSSTKQTEARNVKEMPSELSSKNYHPTRLHPIRLFLDRWTSVGLGRIMYKICNGEGSERPCTTIFHPSYFSTLY